MKKISAPSLTGIEKLNLVIQKNRRRKHSRQANAYTPLLLFPQPPKKEMMACVIVPVKNERDNIEKTLDALREQLAEDGSPLPFHLYEILLLANNCTDDTYVLAKAYGRRHPEFQLHVAQVQLEKSKAHIGTARRLLMDEAFRRHGLNGHDGVILSTDGDTEVDAYWITHTLREMSSGYDAVGGRILAKGVAAHSKLYYLQDTAYRYLSAQLEAAIDPTNNDHRSCHFQCFGASMAVRCSAYQKAGRLPVIPFLEDEAFSRALYRVDARVRKSSAVKVFTSSRIRGRVKAGLSVHLKNLGKMEQRMVTVRVESLKTLMERWNTKRALRECWGLRKQKKPFTSCLSNIGAIIGISPKWLLAEMDISMYFGEFWEKTEFKMYTGKWKKRQKAIPISQAIGELRCYLKE